MIARLSPLPTGAFFPEQHQLKLTLKAEAGETRDTSLVYDGSDGANAYRAITFIGSRRRRAAMAAISPIPGRAPQGPGFMADFNQLLPDLGRAQDTPCYQVNFDLYDNGVATGLVLDYGDFTLGATSRISRC